MVGHKLAWSPCLLNFFCQNAAIKKYSAMFHGIIHPLRNASREEGTLICYAIVYVKWRAIVKSVAKRRMSQK